MADKRIVKRFEAKTVTIAQSASLSDQVNVEGTPVVGIHMPAAWTTAGLTFQASPTIAGTFMNVYDSSGNELQVSAAASRSVGLVTSASDALSAFPHVKVRSGTSGSAVTQAAARTITFILRS
jgi:hypothetical protein